MRVRTLAVALAVLILGCGQAQYGAAPADSAAVAPSEAVQNAPAMVAREESARAGEADQAGAQTPGPNTPSQSPAGPAQVLYLAYAYTVGFEAPADRIAPLMSQHERACAQAGPRLCQVIGAFREGDPDSAMSGSLSLRAEPQWLRTFMDRFDRDADAAGGRIRSRATNTEDLTRAIVDTEASLRAARTLRDRLQAMLAQRPGRLADLLEVERELARVQSQIDSTESNLAVMRTRVSMSALTLNYQSGPRAVASDTFEPLTRALAGFLGFLVQGLAAIVTLIAMLLPWGLLAGLIAWVVLGIRRRRGGRLFARRPDAPPPA